MNRFIYFDNLRSAAVVLTLAALLLQPWHAFYEESAVIAISIVFFISAYFGASALRIRTISFFLKDKGKHLGWPGLVLLLLGMEEQLVTASLPVTSWVLPWLFLLFAGLALVKQLNHNILQHRIASKPSVPFLLAFIVILAAALFFCQACLPQSLAIPYIAQVRPDWLGRLCLPPSLVHAVRLSAQGQRAPGLCHHGRRLRGLDARQRRDDPDGADTDVIAHRFCPGPVGLLPPAVQRAYGLVPHAAPHFLRPVLRQRTDHHPFDVVLTASGRRPMAENRHYSPRLGDLWLPALPLCPAPHPML